MIKHGLLGWLLALKRHSRLGFLAVVVFMLGQAFFTFVAIEVSPWRNYGMYSRPQRFSETSAIIEVTTHGESVAYERMPDLRTEVLLSPLESYTRIADGTDPNDAIFERRLGWLPEGLHSAVKPRIVHTGADRSAFAHWFAKHVAALTIFTAVYDDVTVSVITYSWASGKPVATDTVALFTEYIGS